MAGQPKMSPDNFIILCICICIALYGIISRLPIFPIIKKIKCVTIEGHKLYFTPSTKFYNKIIVNQSNGDEYVYTETDALTLGYIKFQPIKGQTNE